MAGSCRTNGLRCLYLQHLLRSGALRYLHHLLLWEQLHYELLLMSKLSRQRGATYEREVANEIFDVLGVRIRRNLKQYQVKDEGDLILGKYLIECKRRRKIAVYDFIEQAERACEAGQIPLVIMREDGGKSLALLRLPDLLTLLGNELDPHQSQGESSSEDS